MIARIDDVHARGFDRPIAHNLYGLLLSECDKRYRDTSAEQGSSWERTASVAMTIRVRRRSGMDKIESIEERAA